VFVFNKMDLSLLEDVYLIVPTKEIIWRNTYTIPYLYLLDNGRESSWILWVIFEEQSGDIYQFLVESFFGNMWILMHSKGSIREYDPKTMLIESVLVYIVGIQRRIILEKIIGFLSSFWTTLWESMGTILDRSMEFHP